MNFDHKAAEHGFFLVPLAVLLLFVVINSLSDFIAFVVFILTVGLIFVGSYYVAGYIGGLLQ